MAETMEALALVPVPMGILSDKDYEALIVAAMSPLTKGVEVAPTEIAAEPAKPVDPVETKPESVKPRRTCSKCGHPDGNSVGKIRRGYVGRKWDNTRGIWVYFIDWACQPCLEKEVSLPVAERDPREVFVSGRLFSIVITRNKAECDQHEVRLAEERYLKVKYAWVAILEGKQNFCSHEVETGQCDFGGCEQPLDPSIFAVVDGVLRRFCSTHGDAFHELKTHNKDPRFMIWRGPDAQAKCQRHIAWQKRRAKEEEQAKTPASPELVNRLKGVFDRRSNDERTFSEADKSEASRKARERQEAYAQALRDGKSLEDVGLVRTDKPVREVGMTPSELTWLNHRLDAAAASKKPKKGGGKEKNGGKKSRR